MSVRKAEYSDLDRLMELGKEMREESIIPYPEAERDRVKSFIYHTKNKPYDCLLLVAESQGEVWGFMAAVAGGVGFSSEIFAHHHVFYVHPSKRGSLMALMLVRGFEHWAEAVGAGYTEIAVDTGLNIEQTGKFYEKMGYTHMGGKYIKWQQQQPQ